MATQAPNLLTYDITAYLGDTLNCAVTWKDATGTPIDFTSCTALAQVKTKKSATTAVETFTITLGNSTNNIQFGLSASEVTALGVGKWVYDIQLTFPDTTVRTYIAGALEIIRDVSRP